jgi:hypothetical protein
MCAVAEPEVLHRDPLELRFQSAWLYARTPEGNEVRWHPEQLGEDERSEGVA